MVTSETELRRLTILKLVLNGAALLAVVIVLALAALGRPDATCRGATLAIDRLDGVSACVGGRLGTGAR